MGTFQHQCFILGAGSSYSYGLPLGPDLVDFIKVGIQDSSNDNYQNVHSHIYETLIKLNFEEQLIRKFQEKLIDADPVSIDAFLSHEKNHSFYEIGTVCIALSILVHENPERLRFPDKEKDKVKIDHWYRCFAKYIQDYYEFFKLGYIKVVTFNYDRSLELYLFRTLRSTVANSDHEIENLLKNNIVHVYGKCGSIFKSDTKDFVDYGIIITQKNDYIPSSWELEENYGDSNDYDDNAEIESLRLIKMAAKNLHIINDSRKINNQNLIDAKKIIDSSDRYYLLGFGYDRQNIQVLNLIDAFKTKEHWVSGTAFNYSKEKIDGLNSWLLQNNTTKMKKISHPFYNKTCTEFFNDHVSF